MDASTPLIYSRSAIPERLSPIGRVLALGVAGGCLAVLLVGVYLTPSHNGIGSHRQLGFERCQFEARTNVPCPTCGMTTSFSYFVRGQWVASFYVQPGGMVLAGVTAVTFWAGLYIGITGRPAHRLLRLLPARYYLVPLLAILVLAWAWKIWIHVSGRDGWGG